MTYTLLFDLDDTLLDTHMDAFIPAYFKALSAALADQIAPESMLSALGRGTQAMMSNLDPALSLQAVFEAAFLAGLAVDRLKLQAAIDRFYDEVFPGLGLLTKPIPAAVRVVEWAFSRGHRVVVATNPLFPLKAIQHRLRWAGLPPEKYPFALVTSYENCHFTKESIAYYPEVLAQLGWPEDPVVMIGDDINRDVKPCQTAGLPVFLVRKLVGQLPEIPGVPTGTLESFPGWLERADPEIMRARLLTPESMLACLRSTPAALSSLTQPLHVKSAVDWNKSPESLLAGDLCLLRDLEQEVYLPSLTRILFEENPFLAGVMTDHWPEERQYFAQDWSQALLEFLHIRSQTLDLLQDLGPEWSRTARHSIFGQTSLHEMVNVIAAHDRASIQQLWKKMDGSRPYLIK